jgi:Ca2+-binding EF-hand superfamily protein
MPQLRYNTKLGRRVKGASKMTCREEILRCVRQMADQNGKGEFTVQEVVDWMRAAGSSFAESTIRTHVTSRMCGNAPDNHAVTYSDFVRVRHGVYRLAA